MNFETASDKERLILVLEGDTDQVQLIEQALQASEVRYRVVAIGDGTAAIDFLLRRGAYPDAPRPDLILLDLNLPGKNGREILAEIKAHNHLKRIPIVVLSLSTDQADIAQTYQLQGNCYVIKSFNQAQLFQTIKRIEEFWLRIVTLPQE